MNEPTDSSPAPSTALAPAASPPATPDAVPGRIARSAQLLSFLLKYRTSGVFSGLDADTSMASDAPVVEDGKPEAFVTDLETLGPTFIKIGQALWTCPDMVPPPYLTALERMQDNGVPVDAAEIRAVIESELGVRIWTLFVEFYDKPLESASLAQVHRAVREAPRKISDVLSLLAGNRLQMRVTGLEGPQLMQNLQTIANRISPGVIVAALIAASAMPMRHRCRAGDVRIPGRRARLLSDRQRHGPADGAGGADQRASRGTTRGSRPALKLQGCRGEAGTAHCRFTARAARLNRTPAHWAHPLITRIR